jgi:cyclic-di-GMP-binding protein
MAPGDFLPSPSPRLEDLKSCEDWLARTAPADTPHSCTALLTLLVEIENAPPRHSVYLQILERLRYPVLLAGAEQAKRFAGKPLPLGQGEAAAFVQATHLWKAMLRGYARLLGASLSGKHSELDHSFARLCQRVLACSGEFIGACLLARREFGTDCWKLIHQAYTAAEARGAAAETVADLSVDSSPMAAFAEVLMLQLAQPSRLSHRELGWARKWIRHWSRKAPLGREAPSRGGYAVDLAGHSGPFWVKSSAGAATLRFLDLNRVVHSVNARLRRLEEGAEPAVLGLGSDCARLAAQDLLKTLGRAWFDSMPVRDFPKRKNASPMELVSGFAAIHHAIEGRSVAKCASPSDYSYGEAERLHTFQRVAEPTAVQKVRERGAENWETLEESDDGFRLRRTMPGMRLAHRQLVALRPGGARRFILCHIDWLIEGPDQTLSIGARALKGVAKACAVRWTDHSAQQRSDALMLPVAPGLAPALVLPAGRYQRAREIELKLGNAVRHVTLSGLIERGFDYESFSVS